MTLKEKLITDVNKYTDFTGKQIKLSIHMPNGETETILNPSVENKVQYINNAYDDDLRLKANDKIFIIDYEIVDIEKAYKINWKQKLSSRKFWTATAGFVTALIVAFNVDSGTVEQVSSIIAAFGMLAVYILGESVSDASNKTGEDD